MKLALLGTGLMGFPMAERLLGAGHELSVWNRTRARAEPLAERGARVAARPPEALEGAEAVICVLADAPALREVLLDEASAACLPGCTVIQMGTIAADESRALAAALADRGADYLEAPVLGSTPEASRGTLWVTVGATPEQFERWRPLLCCFGENPRLVGPVGAGATVKLALNQLIAALIPGFSLSLGLVQRSGVEVERFMEVLRESPLYAPTFDKKRPRMQERDYASPNFPLRHLLKDVDLILASASKLGLATEALAGVREILATAAAGSLGDGDYAALHEVIDPPGR